MGRMVTKCVNFTHTLNSPLKIQLECSEGYVIAVSKVLKARREESIANINWCNSAEFSDSDCIHYEQYLTQTLKTMCNTKPLCTKTFIYAPNVKCRGTPIAGFYEIDYIHVEYICVRSEYFGHIWAFIKYSYLVLHSIKHRVPPNKYIYFRLEIALQELATIWNKSISCIALKVGHSCK